MIKLKIRQHSIKVRDSQKGKILRPEEELEKEIKTRTSLIQVNFIDSSESKSAQALNILEIKKRELEEIIEYRTKGSILRPRCGR